MGKASSELFQAGLQARHSHRRFEMVSHQALQRLGGAEREKVRLTARGPLQRARALFDSSKKVTLPSASLGLAVEGIWGWPFGLALREKSRGRGLQPKVEGRRPSTIEGEVEVKEEGRAEGGGE